MSDVEKLILDQLNKIEGSINVLRAENQEEFRRVYDKIGALEEKTEAVHTQTTKTNGRVTRLEDKHLVCSIVAVEARVSKIEKDVELKKVSEDLKDTDEYKAGYRAKVIYKAAVWTTSVAAGFGVLIGILVYLKDIL